MGYFKINTRVYASRTPEYMTLHYKIMQVGEYAQHSRVHLLPAVTQVQVRALGRIRILCVSVY